MNPRMWVGAASPAVPAVRRGRSGVSLVEFALVAPVLMLLILGILVLGVIVSNQVQLTNIARDGARAAAVCGGSGRAYATTPSGTAQQGSTTLPNGRECTRANLIAYINSRFNDVPGGVTTTVEVCAFSGTCSSDVDQCSRGALVNVSITYRQPLYVPLVGRLFADDGSSTTRTLTADAEATCEQ